MADYRTVYRMLGILIVGSYSDYALFHVASSIIRLLRFDLSGASLLLYIAQKQCLSS